MKMTNMTINFIMHRLLKFLAQELATITVGVTAESAVMPTVIVALSAHHVLSPAVIDSDFRRKKKGHERPKLKFISASKVEIKKKMAQICCL